MGLPDKLPSPATSATTAQVSGEESSPQCTLQPGLLGSCPLSMFSGFPYFLMGTCAHCELYLSWNKLGTREGEKYGGYLAVIKEIKSFPYSASHSSQVLTTEEPREAEILLGSIPRCIRVTQELHTPTHMHDSQAFPHYAIS